MEDNSPTQNYVEDVRFILGSLEGSQEIKAADT